MTPREWRAAGFTLVFDRDFRPYLYQPTPMGPICLTAPRGYDAGRWMRVPLSEWRQASPGTLPFERIRRACYCATLPPELLQSCDYCTLSKEAP